MSAGTLYGVGVGPGDSELVTLKARRIIQASETIAYPAPLDGPSLARRIAAAHIPQGARELPLRLDIAGGGDLSDAYDGLADDLAQVLSAGSDVALLCSGDAMLYGSFVYFHRRLAGRFACHIVPGVSAINACAAEAATPLALGDSQLAVLPATLPEQALAAALDGPHGAAVVKTGRHAAKLQQVLARSGRLATAVYIARAGLAAQAVAAFGDVDPAEVPYFATVIVPPVETGHDA